MKNILLSCFFVASLFSTCVLNAQEKRALIIAIGNYDYNKTKWSPLSSANDVPLVKNALMLQGFQESKIRLLKDNEATKKGIERAFNEIITQTGPGDMVCVHFSGHGQQIQDDNDDEIDGFDEALIPTDAQQFYVKNMYEGQNHLRDDEFGRYLDSIRIKAGPTGNVMVVVDACHSGTSTRGDARVRGTAAVFAQPGYSPKVQKESSSNFGLFNNNAQLAPMVCFYASASHQLNYEYKMNDTMYVGSLSYAFSKALAEASPATTYKGLFDRIRLHMTSLAPNQMPQIEGSVNQQILGGKILGPSVHAMVIKYKDNLHVTLNKGLIHGLNKDSKVGFYEVDVRDYKNHKPKATGTVTFVDGATAQVALDAPLNENDALRSWVYVTEQNFGDMQVRVKIDLKNTALANALKVKIDKVPLIKTDPKNFDLIIEENNKFTRGNNVMISTAKDMELWSQEAGAVHTDETSDDIIKRIIGFAQSRYLRNLEAENKNLKASVEIIPIEVNSSMVEVRELPLNGRLNESGNLVLAEGDYCKFRITNEGSQAVYFTLLDLQPDDKINILIPFEGSSPDEFRLIPGKTYESKAFEIFPPYGTEVFKLITSEYPLDLASVIQSGGGLQQSRGAGDNPFSVLFAETFKPAGSTRGPKTPNLPSGSVNIKSAVFHIKAKN